MNDKKKSNWSYLGSLIALGIVYGDIGTSPLYTMNSILNSARDTSNLHDFVIGSVSLVFWTLMMITTIKYVFIALKADNHGEGGIFALYNRVRNPNKKWLLIPALVGGAALLADGTLTPAVTVTTAIEGLKGQAIGSILLPNNQMFVVVTVTLILLIVFTFQKAGTRKIGNIFGPVMFLWFMFIGVFGLINIFNDLDILKALSPMYAIKILFSPENKSGIFILGSIFLATTGAEALYSDMGHVGKGNIYFSWPFVYGMLILSYMGQGAWIMSHTSQHNLLDQSVNPFFAMLPESVRLFSVLLATAAAVIASQALISGAYTLVSEAINLKVMPRLRTFYPGLIRGQMYIGTVNWLLFVVGVLVVWTFKTSHNMEAAYGLSITITMLMTTLLLYSFIKNNLNKTLAAVFFVGIFMPIELVFLIASLSKFTHGGYVTLIIMIAIFVVMIVWFYGNKRREALSKKDDYLSLKDYRKKLVSLSQDTEQPIFATNLAYIVKVHKDYQLKRSTIYSILGSRAKRAEVYWFVSINEVTIPYERSYSVDMLGTRNIAHVTLNIGFKTDPQVNLYLKQIANNLMKQGVIDAQFPKYAIDKHSKVGEFKYVMVNQDIGDVLNTPNFSQWTRFLIGGRLLIQDHTVQPGRFYGLETSDVLEETVPLFINDENVNRVKITQLSIKNELKKDLS